LLRWRFRQFTEEWFPAVDFSRIPDTSEHSLANLFTAMAFMHFNIAVGIVLILIARLLYAGSHCCTTAAHGTPARVKRPKGAEGKWPRFVALMRKACAAVCRFVCAPAFWIACCFLVVSTANLLVTSHLFRRVDCMARTLDTRFSVPDCMKWTFDERNEHRPKARFSGPDV
jgi:hypothetical protein